MATSVIPFRSMMQDVSETSMPVGAYFSCHNMRVVTDEGVTNGSIVNMRGNKFHISIPNAPRVFLVKASTPSVTFGVNVSFTQNVITTNGAVLLSFTYSAVNYEEFFNAYEYAVSQNVALQQMKAKTARPTVSSVVFWLEDFANNLTALGGATGIQNSLYAYPTTLPVVIGYTTIREDVAVLFTASNDSNAVEGQIWKLTFDHTTSNAQIKLIYHGLARFSVNHPIQAVGRYESNVTQRVYWTDNFNPVRALNIEDPNAMGLVPDLLNLQSSVNFTKPTFNGVIGGGKLLTGTYQYAYRLKGQGLLTRFSPMSQIMHIVPESETTSAYFKINSNQYIGSNDIPRDSGKAIRLILRGLDVRYRAVEVVAIHRQDATSTPTVHLIQETQIPTSGVVNVLHSGNEVVSELAVEDFLFLGVTFDRAKTISTKDNRLLVGNVVSSDFADLVMDARAYRWTSTRRTYVGSGAIGATDWQNIDLSLPTTPQPDRDAINPTNLTLSPSTFYVFQSDGTTLGGEGVNVSYKFWKHKLDGDSLYSYKPTNLQASKAPFTAKARATTFVDLSDGQTAVQPNHWGDYKNPLYNGMVKGYHRGEIYRFGLVLYDMQGRPGFVNWIGDIRFPEWWNTDNDLSGTGHSDFHIAKKDGNADTSDRQGLNALGLEFTVTIPVELRSKVSGYSIVRVERTETDKTRLGTGIVQNIITVTGADNPHETEDTYMIPWKSDNARDDYDPMVSLDGAPEPDKYIMYSPEFLMRGAPQHKEGDLLILYAWTEQDMGYKDSTNMRPFTEYYKCWDQITPFGAVNPATLFTRIEDALPVGKGQTAQLANQLKFINYAWEQANLEFQQVGNDCLLFQLDTSPFRTIQDQSNPRQNPHGIGALTAYNTAFYKWFACYSRQPVEQYGGYTEADRAKNVYYSCNNFIPISPEEINFTKTFRVMGGDMYVTMFGNTNLEKNIGEDLSKAIANVLYPESIAGNTQMTGFFFPAECTFNNELRYGYHLANKADQFDNYLFPDITATGFEGQFAFDQYHALSVYDKMIDDLVFFIPQPYDKEFVVEYDTRVYASNVKINGTDADAWRHFAVDTYIDVEGTHGPINDLVRFQDNVYFLQDSAVGRLVVNPRVVVPDQEGTALELGNGGILHDYDYITTIHGCKHQWSVLATDSAIYWYDVLNKKIMRLAGNGDDPISDIKGMSAFVRHQPRGSILHNDNPITNNGISVGYDKQFHEVLFTFRDTVGQDDISVQQNFTLCYSEVAQGFTAFYDCCPAIYVDTKRRLLSPSTNGTSWGDLYEHNTGPFGSFYGVLFPSKVRILDHESAAVTKEYTNLSWDTNVFFRSLNDPLPFSLDNRFDVYNKTWSRIRAFNSYQSTGFHELTLSGLSRNARRVERMWRMKIPRNAVNPSVPLGLDNHMLDVNLLPSRKFKEVMRGTHLYVDFEFDNDGKHKINCNFIQLFMTPSFR
jgi:hypothetical protein